MEPSDTSPGEFMPPSSKPRPVSGGIRLQSRRGGSEWWTRRWLAALEATAVGDRLERGLDDARRGQVLELDISRAGVSALVQGTRRNPERVQLQLTPLPQDAWLQIAAALAGRGASRAEVLAGRMPDDVEAACRRAGVELFPALEDDLQLSCTCEDWAVPCRHVLAVAALVGEVMDTDPLLAFQLRGIEPEVLRALVAGRDDVQEEVDAAGTPDDGPALGAFWTWAVADDAPLPPIDLTPPSLDAPLVRILGAPRMWRGADDFEPVMRRLHARVATDPRTIEIALSTPHRRSMQWTKEES